MICSFFMLLAVTELKTSAQMDFHNLSVNF